MVEFKREQVKRKLVRYIIESKMKMGTKLPSLDFFRKEFGCGMTTVKAAVDDLVKTNILKTKDKIGTTVIDPTCSGYIAMRIAIMAYENSLPFNCILVSLLQRYLTAQSCSVETFYQSHPKEEVSAELLFSCVPALKRRVEQKNLDGIIFLQRPHDDSIKLLKKKKIPFVFMGPSDLEGNRLIFELNDVLKRMYKRVKELKLHRPVLILPRRYSKLYEPLYWKTFGNKAQVFYYDADYDKINDSSFAEYFLEQPETERPDAVISPIDHYSMHAFSGLARHLPLEKYPVAFILRNIECIDTFPVGPAVYYDFNIHEYSTLGCEMLLNIIQDDNKSAQEFTYSPKENNAFTALSNKGPVP